MRKINMLACLAIVLLGTTLMSAQATRTWVSGVGDDANPCSRTAPCKTFAGAISKTAPGGEIDALDPGGFGALTITKSITIDGGGGQVASVLVAGTNGIVVAAQPGDVVFLNNLRFDGLRGAGNANAGLNGIRFLGGAVLNITNCVIFGFNNNGIDLSPTQANDSKVVIWNTIIKNCGGDGVHVEPAGGGKVHADVAHSLFAESANGLHAKGGGLVSARNCVFTGNSSNGVWSDGAVGGSIASVRVWESQLTHNTQGVLAGLAANAGISRVELAQNQIQYNSGTGVVLSTGAAVDTFGNNSILENGANGCGGCTPVGPGG